MLSTGLGAAAQPAERRLLHQEPQPLQLGQVFQRALAGGDLFEDLQHPHAAFAAGRTLAARLVLREGHVELGDVDHAVVLVEDDHPAAAHDRAGLGQAVEIDGDVDPLGGDAAPGRAAGLDGLELLAAGRAAADLVDHLAERGAHRHFHQAGVADLAGQGEDLGAAAFGRADAAEPVGPVVDHGRHVGEGLDVVDDRRLAPQAALRGIGRADPRLPALAFNRMDQGRFFAADEGPRAEADFQVEIEARAEDVLAQQAPGAALVDGVLDAADGHRVLGADIEETPLCADGIAADQHAFHDVQRVGLQHAAVHELAGVAFVGVADDVADLLFRLGGHGPFLARGETAAAAAAEFRAGDLVDDPLGIARLEHLDQGLEAAVMEVLFHALRIEHAVVPQGHPALAIEEGHVAVKLEELPANRLAMHLQAIDDLAAENVLADHFVQIRFILDAIEDLVGPDEHVRAV